jgi:hypothetical protein
MYNVCDRRFERAGSGVDTAGSQCLKRKDEYKVPCER